MINFIRRSRHIYKNNIYFPKEKGFRYFISAQDHDDKTMVGSQQVMGNDKEVLRLHINADYIARNINHVDFFISHFSKGEYIYTYT